MNENFEELLTQFAANDKNYKEWRKIHTQAFGKVFSDTFKGNDGAQIHLTAALIKVSQRAFGEAAPKLEELLSIATTPTDTAAIHYFTGLNHEMMENIREMSEHYDALLASPLHFELPVTFHPYYRTAKLAQKSSECSKAIHYYTKALDFFSDRELSKQDHGVASFILFDLANVHLYMHEYDAAEQLLKVSCRYSPETNHQRDYVTVILHAVRSRWDECNTLLENLPRFYQDACKLMVKSIRNGTDLHYFAVPQDRTNYGKFAKTIRSQQEKLTDLIARGSLQEAENVISKQLTNTLSFARRPLECKIEPDGERIVVHCKHYRIKTLIAEQEALFAMLRDALPGWEFVPVSEFEPYPNINTN